MGSLHSFGIKTTNNVCPFLSERTFLSLMSFKKHIKSWVLRNIIPWRYEFFNSNMDRALNYSCVSGLTDHIFQTFWDAWWLGHNHTLDYIIKSLLFFLVTSSGKHCLVMHGIQETVKLHVPKGKSDHLTPEMKIKPLI